MIIYGFNPVREAVMAGRARVLFVSDRSDQRMRNLLQLAGEQQIPLRQISNTEISRLVRGGKHQGVAAEVEESRTNLSVTDLITNATGTPLLVVLDQIVDPRNVGAIVRTVDAVGGDGVIVQERRSAAMTGAAVKASAGAMSHVPIVTVVNIARSLRQLKEMGVWTIALTLGAPTRYDQVDWAQPSALVLGSEEVGMRRLVREACDVVASIPMRGHVESLNVSVAAAVALFEALRQRSGSSKTQ